jgi:hypothetical protein
MGSRLRRALVATLLGTAGTLVVTLLGAAATGCWNFDSVTGNDAGPDGAAEAAPPTGDDSGAPEAGDGGASFCASLSPQPTFCADFNEPAGGSIGTGWTQLIQQHGQLTVDNLNPFSMSAPYSLLAQTDPESMGQYNEADALKLFQGYGGQKLKISASFEMRIEGVDTSTSGQIIAFEIIFKNSTTQFNQIALNLNSLGNQNSVAAQIAENAQGPDGGAAGYFNYPFAGQLPAQTWTKVEVELTANDVPGAGSASNVITVKVGGTTELSQQGLQVPLQGGDPWVHLGIGYQAPSTGGTGWQVRYDNFAFNITVSP